MKNEKLALLKGSKTIKKNFKHYRTIGPEEISAVTRVMKQGVLSKFLGTWSNDFYGGTEVLRFEKSWARYFKIKYAVSVNSATSGLIAAVGAIGIEPGDEVITSPWSMCASATAILVWGGIPVFADIEESTFNLDPEAVEKCITEHTKAILIPDIFGQAAKLDPILKIANKYGLKTIEDSSQAPGAKYKNKWVGTIADIGVFSLNYHKHVHTGEGGVCVTNNAALADRMCLIRNHAEAVVGKKGTKDIANMVGFNFRLTELQAAIGIEQLKKMNGLIRKRQKAAEILKEGLKGLKGLQLPQPQAGSTHVYYMFGMIIDFDLLGVKRERLIQALQAEGIPGLYQHYANIHLLPIYQQKTAFGRKGYPWHCSVYSGNVSYKKGICPVAEKLYDQTYVGFSICLFDLSPADASQIAAAFHKVWRNLDVLKS